MLNNVTNTMMITANSQVDGENVMFLSASIRTGLDFNINKQIQNFELYTKNTDVCNQDYIEFENHVNSIAQQIIK